MHDIATDRLNHAIGKDIAIEKRILYRTLDFFMHESICNQRFKTLLSNGQSELTVMN